MGAKRYFEFSDGSSNKFWEVWIDGHQVFTRYGKIGANGQITMKDEGSEASAQKLHDKLLREKTGKGYQEKTAGGAAAATQQAPEKAAPVKVKAVKAVKEPEPAADDGEDDDDDAGDSGALEQTLLQPDAALAAIVGAEPLLRTEVVKRAWAYIKKHGLQDQKNKRSINADAALKKVFGASSLDMFQMTQALARHLSPAPPAATQKAAPPADADVPGVQVEAGYRRFEFSEGGSNKFWEVKVEGETQTVRYGKIGTPGQAKEKEFDSASEAKADTKKLIAEKSGKGYREVGGAKPWGNPQLEATIEAALDDDAAYQVYADWLQSQGDPLGELIALQVRAAKSPAQAKECTKQANALIKKHVDTFFGPLAPMYESGDDAKLKVEWQFGFLKSATIGWGSFEGDSERDAEADLAALVDLPVARFLQELNLGPVPGDDHMSLRSLTDALHDKKKPTTLRSLYLGDVGSWDISSTSTGDFGPLAQVFPRLEKLTLHGGEIGFGKPGPMPALKELALQTGGLDAGTVKQLCAMKWPGLERLELWFGEENYGGSCTEKHLAPILAGTNFPALKHLGIMNCTFVNEAVKALIDSKVLKQLTSLDLSMGCLTDATIDAMVARKAAFAHLEELNLDDNALTPASKPKVGVLAKKVDFGNEQDPERAGEDHYRYCSVGE